MNGLTLESGRGEPEGWGNSGESSFEKLWRPEAEPGPVGLNRYVYKFFTEG